MSTRTSVNRARFIFISDESARSARAGSWPSTMRVGWRITAGNNRALGRSGGIFASLVECRAAAMALHVRIDDVAVVPTLNETVGNWTWSARLDSAEVAVCMHPFLRRIDCQRAVKLFVEAVRASDPSAAELRYFGPRALRTYDRDSGVSPS